MRRLLALLTALAMVSFVMIGCQDRGPTGKAVGTVKRSAEFVQLEKDLWGALGAYEGAYLSAHASQLQAMPDDPQALLASFDKLMFAITGPSGIWRSHVPNKYFGCSANHDLPICQQFAKLELAFLPWETLHVRIGSINSPQEAEAFLTQYSQKLKQYLEYYVPKDKSLEAVQATPFFKDRMSMFLP